MDSARQAITALKDSTARSTLDVLERWNDADIALRDAGSLAGLLAEVHPDAAVRTLAEDLVQRLDAVEHRPRPRPDLYGRWAASTPRRCDALGADAGRFHEHVLRDFRRAGVVAPRPTARG